MLLSLVFQDSDPFKSKENLFSSSETGELYLSCIFLQLANLPTEAIFDAVLVTIRFQLTCINYQRFLDDLLPEITSDWRFR